MRGGEVHMVLESVGFFDLFPERPARRLVVRIHADDVDDIVTRVTRGPGNGVAAAVGCEIETEFLARNGAHGGDNAVPVHFPRRRGGPAAMRVRGSVHLPAQHDHRIGHTETDQPSRQGAEVLVVPACRAFVQLTADDRVPDVVLVALQHGNVEYEQSVVPGLSPLGPVLQEVRGALDVGPQVPREIGVPDADIRTAEPGLEGGNALDSLGAVVEIGAHRGRGCPRRSACVRRTVRNWRSVRIGRCRTRGKEGGRDHTQARDRQPSATGSLEHIYAPCESEPLPRPRMVTLAQKYF